VHCCETLLAIENNVLSVTVTAGIPIDMLTGKGFEIFLLAFPKKQASDVIV
jgi:hypothetical protein